MAVFWICRDGSLPILASIFQMNEATDLGVISIERSFSVDHFSSLIFENSLKKIELCSIKDGTYHDGEEVTYLT